MRIGPMQYNLSSGRHRGWNKFAFATVGCTTWLCNNANFRPIHWTESSVHKAQTHTEQQKLMHTHAHTHTQRSHENVAPSLHSMGCIILLWLVVCILPSLSPPGCYTDCSTVMPNDKSDDYTGKQLCCENVQTPERTHAQNRFNSVTVESS